MRQLNNEQTSSFPLPTFRIWLCGPFQVERCVGSAYQTVRTAEWGGTNLPRLLLKALLSRPGRRARRETLLEMLWPELESEQALQNLNTAVSKLRNVLRLSRESDCLLITEDNTTTYRLPDQSVMWVDTEAALLSMQDAERTKAETLTLLEDAERHFRRGGFLEGEEGLWVSGRRATIERACYRCCLRLADMYEQRGQLEQAETQLSLLLEDDPTDEDALRRLMLLLHRQGMTHQALRLYEQTCQQTIQEGGEVSAVTKKLAQHMRQRETGQPFLHDQPLGNSAGSVSSVHAQHLQETIHVPPYPTNLFAQNGTGEQQLGMWLLQYADYICREQYPLDAMTEAIRVILPVVEVMQMITRRQFLFSSPAILGSLASLGENHLSLEAHMKMNEAMNECVAAGWRMFHTASHAQILAISYAQLTLIQQMGTIVEMDSLPTLYSAAYNLMGAALYFQGSYHDAYKAHSKGYTAALEGADSRLMTQSRIWQAIILKSQQNYEKAAHTIDAALRLASAEEGIEGIRTRAQLLAAHAENAALVRDTQMVQQRLGEAEELLEYLVEPNEVFDKASWYEMAGLCAIHAQHYDNALHYLQQAASMLPSQWLLRNATVMTSLTIAYAQLREKEKCIETIQKTVPFIQSLNAPGTNRQFFTYTTCAVREAFPDDTNICELIQDVQKQLSVSKHPRLLDENRKTGHSSL